jgi:hypothetical protein
MTGEWEVTSAGLGDLSCDTQFHPASKITCQELNVAARETCSLPASPPRPALVQRVGNTGDQLHRGQRCEKRPRLKAYTRTILLIVLVNCGLFGGGRSLLGFLELDRNSARLPATGEDSYE